MGEIGVSSISEPNKAVEPTRNSLRSFFAPALARGSPPALGDILLGCVLRKEVMSSEEMKTRMLRHVNLGVYKVVQFQQPKTKEANHG